MTPAQLDLARQLAALPGFRWTRGMRSAWSQLPEHGGHRTTFAAGMDCAYTDPWFDPVRGRWTCDGPDLTDDATGGVLLGWLAEMGVRVAMSHTDGVYSVWTGDAHDLARYSAPTLAEACARALVAAGRCA